MTEGDCSHDSQAVAWVLGTLSAEETERFAAHRATCETCAPLVARIGEVVDVLPDAVPQEVPPAELRARVMSAVEAEANLFRAAEVGPWPEPARARMRTPGALVGVVVVSLLAVGVLVGSALTSNKRNGEPRTAVRTALARLPPDQLKVLELAYFGGRSQSEIATELGVALGTVKGRTRLALDKLRIALEGSAPAPG